MKETTHILTRDGVTIMLKLDEETGQFDLYPCSLPPSPEQLPEFHAAIKCWCKQIARGWARRNFSSFSTNVEFFNDNSGKFEPKEKTNDNK
jgi:hypothetical protein